MTTKEKIEVMQAFVDGKTIQYKQKLSNQWHEWLHWDEEPYWSWSDTDYRIKPEPKIRFTPLKR